MISGLFSQMTCGSPQNIVHIAEDSKAIFPQINVIFLSVDLREIGLTGNAAFM